MSLIEALNGPDGDLLGTWRITTGGLPGHSFSEERIQLRGRYHDPKTIRAGLERAKAEGYRAVLSFNHPRLLKAFGSKPDDALPAVVPILPNLQDFMRDAVEQGMRGAGMNRLMRLNLTQMPGLVLHSLPNAGKLLQRDFCSFLQGFVELELATFKRYKPPLVFLHPRTTDLALAMKNPAMLEMFAKLVRNRTGAAVGFATQNLSALFKLTSSAGIEYDAILAPWSTDDSQMRPNAETCHQTMKKIGEIAVWADRLGMAQPPSEALREDLNVHGLSGFARDDVAVWS